MPCSDHEMVAGHRRARSCGQNAAVFAAINTYDLLLFEGAPVCDEGGGKRCGQCTRIGRESTVWQIDAMPVCVREDGDAFFEFCRIEFRRPDAVGLVDRNLL